MKKRIALALGTLLAAAAAGDAGIAYTLKVATYHPANVQAAPQVTVSLNPAAAMAAGQTYSATLHLPSGVSIVGGGAAAVTALARGRHASWTLSHTRVDDHVCTHAIATIALAIATPAADVEDPDVVTATYRLPVELVARTLGDAECPGTVLGEYAGLPYTAKIGVREHSTSPRTPQATVTVNPAVAMAAGQTYSATLHLPPGVSIVGGGAATLTALARGRHASWTVAHTRNADHACTHALAVIALTITTPAADAESEDVVAASLALPVELAARTVTRFVQCL